MVDRQQIYRPLIFGEVLFDIFPDGRQVLGGAPFNVAWHLRGLGLDPLLVSRVGSDQRGEQILQRMAAWGLDVSGVQRDARRPTGEVRVRIERNEPHFEVLEDRAFDHIELGPIVELLADAQPDLIYHGSLAARSAVSRATLHALIRELPDVPLFLDVNLRAPWWESELLGQMLGRARWVKLNLDELQRIAPGPGEPEALCRELMKSRAIELVVLTLGAHGALLVPNDCEVFSAEPPGEVELVDTVGAGDAFSAAMIAAILRRKPLSEALQSALCLAARVCAMRGATSENRSIYNGLCAAVEAS
ncbi:MAG: carbohydrate kinase [Candidatus Alcyoniella australis]|nr:carbohydrate kinase [Candidatus Alcyoniella australis]